LKEIYKPNGEVYCFVSVEQGLLKIKLNDGPGKGYSVHLSEKIIPQLKQALTEAEFFKTL
jgi:hypothetical protein